MEYYFIITDTHCFSNVYVYRELKNKATGVDLSIPTVKGISSLLSSSFEYNIVVVSNLQYFKLPQHKDTDVVQFVVIKNNINL